jgi:hypothetical protein
MIMSMGRVVKAILTLFLISIPSPVSASESATIFKSQSYTANIASVGNIWSSMIPTAISFPAEKSYIELEFPIQGILPYKVLSDRATGVEVDFELWTTAGTKISSRSIYSSIWNPVGPYTLVGITLFKKDLFGDLVWVISTEYQTSTTGLLTRYLSTEIKIPLTIQGIEIPVEPETGIRVETSEEYTANIATVGNIWKGKIPTRLTYPLASYSQSLIFSVQGLLPYSSLADKATGVEVEFELWNSKGKKIASETVYSFDWNPVGPNTLISMRLGEDDSIGNHTLIIRTIYELSTTGLLTRYVQQEDKKQITVIARKKDQKITFKQISDISIDKGSFTIYSSDLSSSEYSLTPILRSSTPNVCETNNRVVTLLSSGICTLVASQGGDASVSSAPEVSVTFKILAGKPKVPSPFTGSRQGNSIQYSIGGTYDLNTRFDVAISPILNPSLSPTSGSSFYGPAVLRTITSQSFTITAEEINSYYNGIVLPYSKYDSTFLIRVRAVNDSGVSDWSTGIYTEVKNLGIIAPIVVSPNPGVTTAKKTITCVKGKLNKKVTAVSPKCPKGYKKK